MLFPSTGSGGDSIPQFIIVKQNGQRIYINFNRVPGPGNSFTMQIPGVEISQHNLGGQNYDYLWFPPATANAHPDDITISLTGPLVLDSLNLPFNGGRIPPIPADQPNEITVRID